jgi:hypothetical protein
MNRADEEVLAWALTDSATAFLKAADHAWLCAKIGAGEQGSAIRELLVFYANTHAELPSQLAGPILAWIQGYSGTDCEAILRRIYDRISLSDNASRQPPEPEAHRLPRRLVAKRSPHAARTRTAARGSTYAMKRAAICGITTSVDGLVAAAIDARSVAQKAIEVAVREARSVNWSWDQISAALGGEPSGEVLRGKFGSRESD